MPRKKNNVRAIVRQELNKKIETKEIEYDHTDIAGYSLADVSYGTSSFVSRPLDGITQGVGDAQRIGTKITLRGMYFRFALQSKTAYANFRLMVVTPKGDKIEESTTSAFIQQLLSNTASSATQYLAPVDTDLYKVHYDKYMLLREEYNGTTAYPMTRFATRFLKFNKPITYVPGSTSALNQIFFVAISDNATSLSYPGAVAGFLRLYYQDA